MRRGFAIAVVFGGFALLVAGFVALIVPTLVTQLSSLIDNLPGIFDQLRQNETIRNLDDKYQIVDKIQSSLTGRVDEIFSGVLGAAQVLAGVVFSILTITILTLYFLAAFHPMKAMAYRLAPASRRARVSQLTDEILIRAGGYVTGQLTISGLAGVCAYIFLRIADVRFASALALLIALFSLIPMVGATIGSVLVAGIASTQSIGARHRHLDLLHPLPAGRELRDLPARDEAGGEHPPSSCPRGRPHRRQPARIRRRRHRRPVVAGIQLIIEEVIVPRQETV